MDGSKLLRLRRQLLACDSPQAVLAMPNGKFQLIQHDSLRLRKLLVDPRWSSRIKGVFQPNVDPAILQEEVG
jgi:hypothetical protein